MHFGKQPVVLIVALLVNNFKFFRVVYNLESPFGVQLKVFDNKSMLQFVSLWTYFLKQSV